jgi:hypothetical protein
VRRILPFLLFPADCIALARHCEYESRHRTRRGTMTETVISRREMKHALFRGGTATWIIFTAVVLVSKLQSSLSFVPRAARRTDPMSLSPLYSVPRRGKDRPWSEMSQNLQRRCTVAAVSIAFLLGTWNNPLLQASASDQLPAGQRYWSIMSNDSTSSVQERIAANEALLD